MSIMRKQARPFIGRSALMAEQGLTGGRRDGRVQDIVGGGGNSMDCRLTMSGPEMLQKNPEEVRLIAEDLNGVVRRLGFIIRCGDLYVLGQRSDLLKIMLQKD